MKGEVGDVGLQGLPGPRGTQGSEGLKGAAGVPGVAGPKGDTGDTSTFGKAMFSSYKTSKDGNTRGATFDGLITFDSTILGDDLFDKDTGMFTCETSGVYIFFFSGEAEKSTWIGVYLNDDRALILHDGASGNIRINLSYTWTLDMVEGDKVHLQIESGHLYVDDNSTPERVYFSGFLMKPSTE